MVPCYYSGHLIIMEEFNISGADLVQEGKPLLFCAR